LRISECGFETQEELGLVAKSAIRIRNGEAMGIKSIHFHSPDQLRKELTALQIL